MSFLGIVVPGLVLVTFAAITIVLAIQLSRAHAQYEALRTRALALQSESNRHAAEVERLGQESERHGAEIRQKDDWLYNQDQDIKWMREELEARPKLTRRTYKILTLGVKYTGKTSLALKWANPLVDLGTLPGTKIERYERTVSRVTAKDVATEHIFEIRDWGGEHIVDAQQELVVDEIHGMLIVVDLAGKDANVVEPARIEQQLRAFQPEALQYFFGPKTIASCKAVVLFINKSDILSGTPAQIEAEARGYYRKLIEDLERHKSQIDVRVLVGSASSGHSTHHLFAHFVERILPRNAYDVQLLQRMKLDAPPARPSQSRGNGSPSVVATEALCDAR